MRQQQAQHRTDHGAQWKRAATTSYQTADDQPDNRVTDIHTPTLPRSLRHPGTQPSVTDLIVTQPRCWLTSIYRRNRRLMRVW